MAHRKAGGTAHNLRDSNPQYLGVKRYAGEKVKTGNIIVRQRGTKIEAGKNVREGKDNTLYSIADGIVKFTTKTFRKFNGSKVAKKVVNVVAAK